MLQLWEIGRSMTVNLWDGPKSPSQHWLDSEICAIIRGALTDNFEDHFFFFVLSFHFNRQERETELRIRYCRTLKKRSDRQDRAIRPSAEVTSHFLICPVFETLGLIASHIWHNHVGQINIQLNLQ
jgi:hypothetical protein